jgi:DNA-binding Xre family transcriptional regulator
MKRSPGFLAERLARGLARFRGEESQNQFARRLGISNASLNRIENRVQNVSLRTIEVLCRRLKCDVADLFPPAEGEASRPVPTSVRRR